MNVGLAYSFNCKCCQRLCICKCSYRQILAKMSKAHFLLQIAKFLGRNDLAISDLIYFV